MPDPPQTIFFATRQDLEPALRSVEAQRPLQYVLYDHDYLTTPSVFYTVQDIPILEFDGGQFFILDRETKVTIQPSEKHSKEEEQKYKITVESGKPCFGFAPCCLSEEQYIAGSIGVGEDYTPEDYAIYRLLARAVRSQLQQIGYLYGPEALQLGRQGTKYVDLSFVRGPYIEDNDMWTYEDVEAIRHENEAISAISRDTRLSLQATWFILKQLGYKPPEDDQGRPIIPPKRPGTGRDGPCLDFFRTRVDAEDFHNLTMPRTFYSRSGIEFVSFRGSDLSLSFMRLNDWSDCDFTEADLAGADMRASLYIGCTFTCANLTGADLRGSNFVDCMFTHTRMQGCRMLKSDATKIVLSEAQRAEIVWERSDGLQ